MHISIPSKIYEQFTNPTVKCIYLRNSNYLFIQYLQIDPIATMSRFLRVIPSTKYSRPNSNTSCTPRNRHSCPTNVGCRNFTQFQVLTSYTSINNSTGFVLLTATNLTLPSSRLQFSTHFAIRSFTPTRFEPTTFVLSPVLSVVVSVVDDMLTIVDVL